MSHALPVSKTVPASKAPPASQPPSASQPPAAAKTPGTSRTIALGEDSSLNMTPMIDVCFQLIIFFMLTLRFPSVANRFELVGPKDRGPSIRPEPLHALQHIVVALFRKDTDQDVSRHFTRLRVGQLKTVDLPRGPWPTTRQGEEARREEEDRLLGQVSATIASAWGQQNRDPRVRGEIRTPEPAGLLVPHGDVMRVLDAFVSAGLSDVNFEGARAPQGTKTGGGWDFLDAPTEQTSPGPARTR